METTLFTIGHSNIPAERFISALCQFGVEHVVDVRSRPVSRFAPWSNQRRLPSLLAEHGIAYGFEGVALGGKPDDPALQRDGAPDWDAIAGTASFAEAMDRLLALASERPTAVMCSEEDPDRCHRRHMIAANLPACWAVIDIRTAGPQGVRAEAWERQSPFL